MHDACRDFLVKYGLIIDFGVGSEHHICSAKIKTTKISSEEPGYISVKFCTNGNFSLYSIC